MVERRAIGRDAARPAAFEINPPRSSTITAFPERSKTAYALEYGSRFGSPDSTTEASCAASYYQ
jgi:hypothetical protein